MAASAIPAAPTSRRSHLERSRVVAAWRSFQAGRRSCPSCSVSILGRWRATFWTSLETTARPSSILGSNFRIPSPSSNRFGQPTSSAKAAPCVGPILAISERSASSLTDSKTRSCDVSWVCRIRRCSPVNRFWGPNSITFGSCRKRHPSSSRFRIDSSLLSEIFPNPETSSTSSSACTDSTLRKRMRRYRQYQQARSSSTITAPATINAVIASSGIFSKL
mmetsp:Transcript_41131/g.108046  ORF Transcript_41131/g.108046 Transcript_41131/m.108046 type:complete len:220 (-) Transcript_41131:449-1108(-)